MENYCESAGGNRKDIEYNDAAVFEFYDSEDDVFGENSKIAYYSYFSDNFRNGIKNGTYNQIFSNWYDTTFNINAKSDVSQTSLIFDDFDGNLFPSQCPSVYNLNVLNSADFYQVNCGY